MPKSQEGSQNGSTLRRDPPEEHRYKGRRRRIGISGICKAGYVKKNINFLVHREQSLEYYLLKICFF